MAMRRTNVQIDELKLKQVQNITGARTIKEAVDTAFQELIRVNRQRKILDHRGMGGWEGDIDNIRGRT